jgi:hypothetical protein
VKKSLRIIAAFLVLLGLAQYNSKLFSQQFMDGLKARLSVYDKNRFLEAEALEFKGNSLLKNADTKSQGKSTNPHNNSKAEVMVEIGELDALIFILFSNELKFNILDTAIKQFWSAFRGYPKDIEDLHKCEAAAYDSINLVYELRRESDREKSIIAKFPLLKKAGYIEDNAILKIEKLLYTYMQIPKPYSVKWVNSEDLKDPYISQQTLTSTVPITIQDTDYQRHLRNGMEIFNLLEITEPQLEFFNEFLSIKYPEGDRGIDFMKVAYANVDTLKNQWQSYLYKGGNISESSISGLLSRISKSKPLDSLNQDNLSGMPASSFSYKVQILASKDIRTMQSLEKIYSGKEKIEENYENKMYKYTIGNFKSYNEARLFRDRIHIQGSFIVAYLNGKRIDFSTYTRLPGGKPIKQAIGIR